MRWFVLMIRLANPCIGLKRLTGGAKTRGDASDDRLKGRSAAPTARRAPGGVAALGNTQVIQKVSAGGDAAALKVRQARWEIRGKLREISTIERVRQCGVVPVAPFVSLRGEQGGRAGYGGLSTCGSVWSCPVCAAKIASARKSELQQVVAHALQHGLHISMLTLTQRHHAGQALSELWDALAYAWNRTASGVRWSEFKAQLGIIGHVRSVEVTHGRHGWHVHTHVLIVSEKDPKATPFVYQRKQGRRRQPYPPEVYAPSDFIADRWERALARKGVDFIRDCGGIDWETARDPERLARYVSKMQAAAPISAEATLGAFKKARGENRTPFQILADFLENEDEEDLKVWKQWENGSRGRRALIWSRGLRAWAGLGVERSDEEIAAEEPGGDDVAFFDRDAWREVRRHGEFDLLCALELGGEDAAYSWLEERHICYWIRRGSPPS